MDHYHYSRWLTIHVGTHAAPWSLPKHLCWIYGRAFCDSEVVPQVLRTSIWPDTPDTYLPYLVFVPHILRHLQYVKRLDVVWDCYRPDRLKYYTRHCRGDGDIIRVADNTSMPGNWTSFLRVDSNKTGLFKFLSAAVHLANVPPDKILLTTNEEYVLSPSPVHLTHLQPCTQEEADYKMMLHVTDAYH